MNVVMADLEGARLDQAADLTRGEADRIGVVEAFATDVADRDAVLRLKARAYARFGRVDVLMNNAGVSGAALRPTNIPNAGTGCWRSISAA